MLCKGCGSLGNATLRLVKSMDMHHLFDSFFNITVLANQDGYFTPVMKHELVNLCTSSSIATLFFLANPALTLRHFLTVWSMVNWWHTTLVSVPSISEGTQANNSMFLLSRVTISSSSNSDKEVPNMVTGGPRAQYGLLLSHLLESAFNFLSSI